MGALGESDPRCIPRQTMLYTRTTRTNDERCDMEFIFSDDFDAVAWHMERMSKPDYDPYYDESDR